MRCAKARLLLLDREADRRAHPAYASVARHLAECRECQGSFASAQIVGAVIAQWPTVQPDPAEQRGVVDAMLAAWSRENEARPRGSFARSLSFRFSAASAMSVIAICIAFLALWPTGPRSDPVAAVRDAMEGVDTWYANGTITPALIPDGEIATNKIELWFKKPDTMRASVDGDVVQLLQEGPTRTWYFGRLNQGIIENTESVDFAAVFSVSEWLRHEAVLASPAYVLGEEWFGEQRVKTIEIRVSETHKEIARELGLSNLVLHANVDSMLPVHVQAKGFAGLRDRVAALLSVAPLTGEPSEVERLPVSPESAPKETRLRNPAADYLTLHLHFKYGVSVGPDTFRLDMSENASVLDRRK